MTGPRGIQPGFYPECLTNSPATPPNAFAGRHSSHPQSVTLHCSKLTRTDVEVNVSDPGAIRTNDVSTSPNVSATAVRSANIEKIDLSARYFVYFMYGGLIFLFAGLCLLILSGFMSYKMAAIGPEIFAGMGDKPDTTLMMARVLSIYLPVIVTILSAFVCTLVGTRLLRSSGIVSTQVIAPQDYPLLGEAIATGNEQAINLFVRLSSLSGATGTFTKIGLTGLPLATIFLTILLSLGGIINAQFYDLAKLTLGAFLGSFVQRQSQADSSPPRPPAGDASRR